MSSRKHLLEPEPQLESAASHPTPVKVLVSERFGLVFVWVPKCASRTLHRIFLDMHGVETSQQNASSFYRHNAQMLQGQYGLSAKSLSTGEAIDLKTKHPEYKWFTIVRDPYRRSLSNYFNKINRFARLYRRDVYAWGKLRQFLGGPKAWKNSLSAMESMKKQISFEEMLLGLRKYGIRIDAHFMLQTEHCRFGEIEYDKIMRMEELTDSLPEFFESANADTSKLNLKKENRSIYASDHDAYFTPLAKEIVEELYAGDFEKLGYPTR